MPRLSIAPTGAAPPAPKGLQIRVADRQGKIGGKPLVKPGSVAPAPRKGLGALSAVAKAGIAIVVILVAIGGLYSYRIFFPAPSSVVSIKSPPIAKLPVPDPAKAAADLLARADDAHNAVAAHRDAAQAKVDAAATGQDDSAPTPTPESTANQPVMVQSNIDSDVKVNNTLIDTSPQASADFRAFVANANIGGVFQGARSKALINGRIVREGQVVDSVLGITFERIDADKKVIYFKDSTGAEVSKEY